ncbi:c-type cytochrome biogenesis protein CcsB [Phytoactinopolyspora mesophila]|uniref:C-type cytochrome biogenesis protein CcsB n=1 Tax=Phytoactinopolyspora mesophila TaxID=2650750 RepID=A0A7K3M314_9ACTN|nr:c-type cytochrome biogenesis protein CcsB [Phytoactinopolyspora mesophila]NDL57703.1 c-type cytochrome biogenesis protein CcsB [Phytoactinopolyspora mesophila]
MDLDSIAEWSRYVVTCALIAYLASWLVFASEAGLRGRIRRENAQRAADRNTELAAVATTDSGRGAAGDGPGVGSQGPDSPGQANAADGGASGSNDLTGYLSDQADLKGRLGQAFLVLATGVLAVGVTMRAVGTGRAPWGNMYEFSITAALLASIVFLVMSRTAPGRAVAGWVVLFVFITLGLAVTVLYVPPGPLVPALRSYWLVIHVGLTVIAFALFTVAAAIGALQIAAQRAERRGRPGRITASLPESSVLDRLGYRLIAIGFPLWTIGPLILGAIWAEVSWGRYWGWDPKEVWALITWLVYAAYLHARATAGWKGSKASVVGLVGFATAMFSYFGVNIFFEGLHSYGGL